MLILKCLRYPTVEKRAVRGDALVCCGEQRMLGCWLLVVSMQHQSSLITYNKLTLTQQSKLLLHKQRAYRQTPNTPKIHLNIESIPTEPEYIQINKLDKLTKASLGPRPRGYSTKGMLLVVGEHTRYALC